MDNLLPLKSLRRALLGIDYGPRRIGLAITDATWMIASSLTVIDQKATKDLWADLAKIIATHRICGIVIGLPRNMDGTDSAMTQAVQEFATQVQTHFPDLPMAFMDERLSTAAVERFLVQSDVSRGRRKEVVDKGAAQYILQGALDRIRHLQAD